LRAFAVEILGCDRRAALHANYVRRNFAGAGEPKGHLEHRGAIESLEAKNAARHRFVGHGSVVLLGEFGIGVLLELRLRDVLELPACGFGLRVNYGSALHVRFHEVE